MLSQVRQALTRRFSKLAMLRRTSSSFASFKARRRVSGSPTPSTYSSSSSQNDDDDDYDSSTHEFEDISLPVMRQISNRITSLIAQSDHQLCHCDTLVQELIRCAVENDGTDHTFAERYGADFALSCAIVAVHYLDLFLEATRDRKQQQRTSEFYSNLISVCFLLAMKLLDDNNLLNADWAQVTGIPTSLANEMELEVCKALEWKLVVSQEDYLIQQQTIM